MACYAMALGLIGYVGRQFGLGGAFYAGLGVAAAIAAYHFTLIRGREPDKCFKALMHNNWLGLSIFVGIAVAFWQRNGPFWAGAF